MTIRIENIEVRYARRPPALQIEQLSIGPGERVAIVGPSGAGKSTLLRTMKGYVRPCQGRVEVLGTDLWAASRKQRRRVNQSVGLIYQQFHLAPRLSVLQNVLCGRLGTSSSWRSLLGWFSVDDRQAAWSSICEVGLQQQVHQRADTLSGGEKQRVAVCRVMAQEPSIVLADEPVSSLDPALAENVLELLTRVQMHHKVTLVMSLHQPHWARRFADRIVALRNGRVVFDGPATAFSSARVQELYRGNTITSTVGGDHSTKVRLAEAAAV